MNKLHRSYETQCEDLGGQIGPKTLKISQEYSVYIFKPCSTHILITSLCLAKSSCQQLEFILIIQIYLKQAIFLLLQQFECAAWLNSVSS